MTLFPPAGTPAPSRGRGPSRVERASAQGWRARLAAGCIVVGNDPDDEGVDQAGAAGAGRFLRHPADGLLGDPEPDLVAGGELGPEPGRTGCTQGLRLCATPEGTCASIGAAAGERGHVAPAHPGQ